MTTQGIIRQCWANAYNSDADYRVEVASRNQAISMRSQCHKWRRRQAEQLFGKSGRPIEDYYFYDLTISIEEENGKWFVCFSRHNKIILPPIVKFGQTIEANGALRWVLIRKPDGAIEIEQCALPFTGDPSTFITARETREEAEIALKNELLTKKAVL